MGEDPLGGNAGALPIHHISDIGLKLEPFRTIRAQNHSFIRSFNACKQSTCKQFEPFGYLGVGVRAMVNFGRHWVGTILASPSYDGPQAKIVPRLR
jgi:hypothetical protein